MAQVLDPELDVQTRKRLFGRIATKREWIDEILRLKLGDPRRHQQPLNNSEIAQHLGISRDLIIDFIKLAINHKLAESDPENPEKIKLREKTFQLNQFARFEADDFAKDSLIQEWVNDMMTRKAGKPIKKARHNFNSLKRLCNTCKVKPEQLIIDRKTTEKIIQNYALALQSGQQDRDKRGQPQIFGIENAVHNVVMAARDFCGVHGVTWRRGVGGIMSGKVVGHGKYADIKLLPEEFERAETFIVDKFGFDSDVNAVWLFGNETCARKTAILTAQLEWTEIPNQFDNSKITFIMKVIETKTEHIKGGVWKKYIRDENLQKLLKIRRSHGFSHLWDDKTQSMLTAQRKIMDGLIQVYKFLGKESVHTRYFMRKPYHTLRHIAAQEKLRQTNYDYTLVCKIGGWHTQKELEDSYGEMPEEIIAQKIDKLAVKQK